MSSGVGSIFAMKQGDFLATEYPGDAGGLAAALTYAGSNGVVQMGPGTESLTIPSHDPGVLVRRMAVGLDERHGIMAFRDSPWVDVKAYGAKGDGTTDDTTALQAAITAAEAKGPGASVFFPYGTYKVTAALFCKRETWLVGRGHPIITFTSTTATLLTWASSTAGSGQMGGGAKGIWFQGNGGTSVGISFGDPAHPTYYASRLSLEHCDVSGFGTGIQIDGPDADGTLSAGECSATDGFSIRNCVILSNVHYGLLNKCNWGIEICLIEQCYFWNNGQSDTSGAGLAGAATGTTGIGRPASQCSYALISTTFNGNGNDGTSGTSAQIYIPATAGCFMHIFGGSFEQSPGGTSCHILALSDGQNASYGMPRAEISITASYFQAQGNSTYRRESVTIAAGQLQIVGSRITQYFTASNITVASCSNTNGQATFTTSGNFLTSKVMPGMLVSGTGVPANSYVKSVDSATQITIGPGTGTGASGVTLTFTPLAACVKAGISGAFTGVSLLANHYQALQAGSSPNSNARVLNLVAGTTAHTSFFSSGNFFDGMNATDPAASGYRGLLINPQGCFGSGDLFAVPGLDFTTSKGMSFQKLGLLSPTDGYMRLELDISKIESYGLKAYLFSVLGYGTGMLNPIVPTANIPAGGSSRDGAIVIEDTGGGDRAGAYVYVNSNKYRARLGPPTATAPTIASGANLGTSPSVSVLAGNDERGSVRLGSGTGTPANGTPMATVTFNTARAAAPKAVILTGANLAAAGVVPYVASISTTGFVIGFGYNWAASTNHDIYYEVID